MSLIALQKNLEIEVGLRVSQFHLSMEYLLLTCFIFLFYRLS